MGCISHTVYIAHGNSKDEKRGMNRCKSNRKRVVRRMEERNVGPKGKNLKQKLTSAKDLTIELSEFLYHRLANK